jgi:uncharacterized protein (DUF2062 family)/SAM-dependent methyltransferase
MLNRASDRETMATRFRRRFHGLRTEGSGSFREAAAIALGVFLGCLPLYGLHLLLCWGLGGWFHLNRLKVYLAANISNPFVAPWLLFAEWQTGALLTRGQLHPLSFQAIRTTGAAAIGVELILGSVVVGVVLALLAGTATYLSVRGSAADGPFTSLVQQASDRYVGASITAWEFARGKLRGDPVYRTALLGSLLPSGGTLLDVGCGQGLTLALFAEARLSVDRQTWPVSWPMPPRFDRMIGIEVRPRVARLARQALEHDAEIVEGDARTLECGSARVILLFDILHLIDASSQDQMLSNLRRTLDEEGVLLIREADASAGWRFVVVRLGNRLKALAVGRGRQSFAFRSREEWRTCFLRHGFHSEVTDMGGGTPFANVLFRLTVRPHAFASTHPPAQSA